MSSRRDPGIDALRGLAMILMTSTHALRTIHPANLPEFASWLFRIEPVTPAIFLLLAGWSIARGRRHTQDPSRWRRRHLLRGLALYAISAATFFGYFGPQWPEGIVSTGILGTLGVCIAIATLIGNRTILAALVFVGAISLRVGLDSRGIALDGLNNGTFAILPNLPIVLAGLLGEQVLYRRQALQATAATIGATWVLVLSYNQGFRNLWGPWGVANTAQEYVCTSAHRLNGFAIGWDLLHGMEPIPYKMRFETPLLSLMPVLIILAGLATLFLTSVGCRFPGRIRPLERLGQHGLVYYLGHLAVLGLLQAILPAWFRSMSWTWLFTTAAVALLGMAYAHIRADKSGAHP